MSFHSFITAVATALVIAFGSAVISQDQTDDQVEQTDDGVGLARAAPSGAQPGMLVRDVEHILSQLARTGDGGQALDGLFQGASTESPQDTIISFIKLTQRYYDLLTQDSYTAQDTAEFHHLYSEMISFFDLRNTPPALRLDVGVNTAVFMREIIDRVGLPPIAEIPDREAMRAKIDDGERPAWTIGKTPLELTLIADGRNQGNYQFSEQSVAIAEGLFHKVESFPYQTTAAQDFYRMSFLTPAPQLRVYTERLPKWSHTPYLDQTAWQWIAMIASFALGFMAITLLSSTLERRTRQSAPLTRRSALLLVPLFALLVSYLLYDWIGDKIFVTGIVFQGATYLIAGLALISTVILIFSIGSVMIELIAASRYGKSRNADVHLASLGIRVVSIIVIIATILQGMHLIGFSLASIVAGAGVTGLAVALAAQNALRNIFGSLMLLLDKPFEVGQRIKLQGYDGFVENIGMRSTRLRLFSGHLVSIPNENVASEDIENVDKRSSIRRTINMTLPADTSPEKIKRAVFILRDVLSLPAGEQSPDALGGAATQEGTQPPDKTPHPNAAINHPDLPPRVSFNEINPNSINVTAIYWYRPPEFWPYFEHCDMVNHEIIRRFRDENIPNHEVSWHALNADRVANPPRAGTIAQDEPV